MAHGDDRGPGTRLRFVRTVGELAVTAALVIVLFVVHQLYVVRGSAVEEQRRITRELERTWERPGRPDTPAAGAPAVEVARGAPFAILRIPALGPDWRFTVVEGTDQEELTDGPGHYVGTEFPGQPGNVGIAGHRVTRAAPFDRLHELRSCDAVVFETQDAWYVYRVLPMAQEKESWDGNRPECVAVTPLTGGYADVVGREIVDPTRTDVLAAVPGHPDDAPPAQEQLHLVTLTTCHPRYSARQRLIIHGVQVATYDKHDVAAGFRPPELDEE